MYKDFEFCFTYHFFWNITIYKEDKNTSFSTQSYCWYVI